MTVSLSILSSGALRKNLTAEQIKEDLVTLGIRQDPLWQESLIRRGNFKQKLDQAAG